MDATRQQKEAIKKLTRRANRRIERASKGQAKALEYYVMKMTGAKKFSAASKGLSYEEAALKLKQLDKFLGAKSTTITGWREIKKKNVEKANETLSDMGYDLTDDELSEILVQIESGDTKEFYRAVNLVQAAKGSRDAEELTGKEIANIISEKVSYQQALERALAARG